MAKRRLFIYMAAASGYIGIGLLLGYALSDQLTNTPLWIGIVLLLLGSILLGMFISAREALNTPIDSKPKTYDDSTPR
ncbi:MAG: hypothetical protein JWP13_967 [Candidatus Saccharibacteria bacterium]|nr:hypothetical protein [Candidatus Saccharibacteria bacterium]